MILIILILEGCSYKTNSIFTFIYKSNDTYRIYELLSNDTSVVKIPEKYKHKKVTEISERSFYRNEYIEKVIISDNIIEIKDYAFEGCSNLSSLYIGKNVQILSGTAFIDTNLSEITINPDNQYFTVINDCLIEKETGALIIGTNNSIIPDGTTAITIHSFFGRRDLISIEVPESCNKIEYAAFANCTLLETVILPEGLEILDCSVFSFCRSLININIPAGIKRLEESVFHACLALETVRIPETIQGIGKGAFQFCAGLTNVYIPKSVTIIESDAFMTPVNNANIHCEASEKPIGWADDWTSSNNVVLWGDQ